MPRFEERLAAAGVKTYPLDVPISAGNREAIENGIRMLIDDLTGDECYCPPQHGCTDEAPQCRFRSKQRLLQQLKDIIEPVHRTLHPDRLSSAAEAIYLKRWQKENQRVSWLNSGRGVLENILAPTRFEQDGMGGRGYIPPVSQRDAEVAASVVQWFGTNCGRCFIEECEKEARTATAERRELDRREHMNRYSENRVIPFIENLAQELAMSVMRPDDKHYDRLLQRLIAAMQMVREDSRTAADGGAT